MARIRLSRSASVTPTDVGVLLRSDLGAFQLDGPDVRVFSQDILPLLDGARDKAGVADALDGYSHHSVLAFLDLLERYGLIESIPDAPAVEQERWRGQEEFFRKWTDQVEAAELSRRLGAARVLIVGLEPWGVAAATELAAAGIGALHLVDDGEVVPDDLLSVRAWYPQHLGRARRDALADTLGRMAPWCAVTTGPVAWDDEHALVVGDAPWDLVVGTAAADDLPLLQGVARFAQRGGVRSLTGYLEGRDAVVGPVVVPGQTACWNCCRLRQLANSPHPQAAHGLQAALFAQRPQPRTRTYLAPMAPLLGHVLALEALKLVSGYTPSTLVGRMLVQDLISLETTVHTVIRMPWCDVCGGASASAGGTLPGGPISVNGSADGGPQGGSQRLDEIGDPARLREALAGWVDERTGVIKRLIAGGGDANEPELPVSSSAVVASYTEGAYRPSGTQQIGSGKGLSATEAMISAVGEAIERYGASRYRASDMHRAALNTLEGDALDPRRLCLYDASQYEDPHFPFAPFSPNRPIDWTRGRWLDTGAPVWLPALPTYLDFVAAPPEQFCQVTSNGLAAGASVEDAALRAVFELVERDAFMLTWLCRLPGLRLLPDDTLDAGAHEVVRQLAEHGAQVELYLLDVGLSIPTVVCLGLGDGRRWPGVTVALAAHADPRDATRKAIMEQGHVGPYIRRLMREGEQPIPASPAEVRTLTDHALYYVPPERASAFAALRSGRAPAVPLRALPAPRDASLRDCSERLSRGGVRVAIADVTSPDLIGSPFRVVRALGVDMQPIYFGHMLQRLSNPRLRAMCGDGLNPHPHPLA